MLRKAARNASPCPSNDPNFPDCYKKNKVSGYIWLLYTLDTILPVGIIVFLIVGIIYSVRQE